MQQIKSSHAFIKMFTLITLCFTVFGFTPKFGLDSYEISLNNKLVLKVAVNQPLSSRILQLAGAKQSDQLRINYTHCTTKTGGTSRSIELRGNKGNVLKKWAFADGTHSNETMTIAIKELLLLRKGNAHHDLSLHYASHELPKGETLAFLKY
ncbi:hypothetical protein DU508_15430 [Pedobacter chinensis]|uniref:Uncharacterized protein n=1 Tax=Pedobacter chinensis TaxID=2282421 RepID=A0A369PSY7_9SPHI|nr:hypothetical protein [Pedobacter chinensis]RDC55663.1 hypothetical protein DU508_15430 [Pedobacter chinensis]